MTKQNYIYSSHQEMVDGLVIGGRPITELIKEIQHTYLGDERPWIVGFSGGKDSTCILSLIYYAVKSLKKSQRKKPIYVVSSDTLVETPVVVDQISDVLEIVEKQGTQDGLIITGHPVHPKSRETFWVNLLGKGYPAPTQKFRWCTERMKIDPVSTFIKQTAAKSGEVILALGSRSKESASRSQVIAKHRIQGTSLGRHSSLSNAFTYMPIVDWDADEVWEYLLSAPCPWGGSNKNLFELYKGSNQGECPMVIDKTTPSCGNSRFGCWTCTVVTKDRALEGLIDSGQVWMKALLDFRNKIYVSTKPENKKQYRNWKRRTGRVSYISGHDINNDENDEIRHIPGPYWLRVRKEWLVELLTIEKKLNEAGHKIELIKPSEIEAIRQEWLRDPNEPDWEDSLPKLFHGVYRNVHIDWVENDAGVFTAHDSQLLRELSEAHDVPSELILKLLEEEINVIGLGKRRGILQKLESILKRDWDSLDIVNKRNQETKKQDLYKEQIDETKSAYEAFNFSVE